MNIAELGIKVDSADAANAATDLDKLTKAGDRAEQSAVGLMNEMQALEKSLSKGATTTQELAKQRENLAKLTKTGAYGEAEFTKITAQLDKQQAALAKSTLDEQKALNSLLGAIDPAKAALAKLDKQVEDLGKHLDAGRISQDQYNSALSKIDGNYAALEKTATGFDRLKLGTRQAQENVVQLGNALSSGDWGSGVRAVAQLGAGAGSAAIGFAAVVVPIALAAGALATLANAYYQGSKEAQEYNKSLVLTGNYAGTNATQLAEMARQISATVGTTGAAAEVLATLAGNGKLASGSFVEISEAALAMEKATGKSVDATVAEFVKIADDPVAAAKLLNDQYHFLTASVYSQIVALKEQGDEVGATKLLTDIYAETVKGRAGEITQNLGIVEKAWAAIRGETAKTFDALKNVGREQDEQLRVAELTQKLAYLQSTVGTGYEDGDAKDRITAITDELSFLKDKRDASADIAKYDADTAKAQQDAVSAMSKVDALTKSSLTNEQKRAEAIKDYKKSLDDIRKVDPKDSRLDPAAVAKNMANLNDKFKDPKAAAGSVDLSGFNSAKNVLAETLAYYKNADKELEASQRAGVISQASYTEQRVSLLQQEANEVAQSYQSEIDSLEAAKTKKGTTAAQVIQIDQKIADARSAMVKAQQDSGSELSIIATNEEGRLRKQTLAVNTYTSALQQQVDTLRQQGLRAASGLGQGDRQRALTDQQNGIDDRFNQQRLELANQYGDGSRGMSLDEYNQKLAALKATQQDLHDTVRANYDDMTAAQGDWSAGASSAWQNYLESARDVAGQTKSLFTNAFSSMEDAIVNFAITGKLSFADFTKSILADMARIATRQASSALLGSLVGAATSYFAAGSGNGLAAGSAGAESSNLGASQAGYSNVDFSGYRAAGGPVAANSLYQVNELGPELYNEGGRSFLMTGANGGSVTPLTSGANVAAMSGGGGQGGITINAPVSVTTLDRSSEGMQLDQQALAKNLQTQMKAAAEKALAESWRAGGISFRNANGRT